MRLINTMSQGTPIYFDLQARKHNQPSTESDPSNYVAVEDWYAEAHLLQRDFHEFCYSETT